MLHLSCFVDCGCMYNAIQRLNQTIDGQTTQSRKTHIFAELCPLVGTLQLSVTISEQPLEHHMKTVVQQVLI